MGHCSNNRADRRFGDFWERQLCELAATCRFIAVPHQIGHHEAAASYRGTDGRQHLLPDVTLLTYPIQNHLIQHHEVKHKNPTRDGSFGMPPMFGLEVYRYHELVEFAGTVQSDVLYTIHNHDLSGGRNSTINDIAHWVTIQITDLTQNDFVQQRGTSYVDGKTRRDIEIFYWLAERWMPLQTYWETKRVNVEQDKEVQ